MPKGFNKWLKMIEPNAKYFMWVFGMVLATATVVNILDILTSSSRLMLIIFLILFFLAGLIVFISDLRRSSKQESTQIPTDIERAGRNRWALLGILALMAIILVPIFVARQLQLDSQGYQTFFIAFAGIGAWVTGIALAVFAYQQYKLRQTEHRLLFEPQMVLTSGPVSITGSTRAHLFADDRPYQIRWTVFIQNTSQIPVVIEHMQVVVRPAGEDSGREASLTPTYCRVTEPDDLTIPFEVSLSKPHHIVWLIEGSAGDVFDYVSGESGNRDFVLVLKVFAKKVQDPEEFIFPKETRSSWDIHVPKDANWVSKTPFLDEALKEKKGNTDT